MDDYNDTFDEAGKQYGLDPHLLRAVAHVESSGNPNAYNSDSGAAGLMQIIPSTAKSLGVDPHDPKQAIMGAAKLLRENLERYGNTDDAVSAYHGGTDRKNWGPKTRAYVSKVKGTYDDMTGGTGSTVMHGGSNDDDLEEMLSRPDKLNRQSDDALENMLGEAAKGKKLFQEPQPSQYDADLKAETKAPPAAETPAAAPTAAPNALTSPAAREGTGAKLGAGVEQGIRDAGGTLANAHTWLDKNVPAIGAFDKATGHEGAPIAADYHAKRDQFDKDYEDSTAASVGRFGGQVLATAPLGPVTDMGLVAAGKGISRAIPALEPAMTTLTGQTASNALVNGAGKVISPATIGNKLVRVIGSAPRAAVQGATTAAGTSSASDKPIGQQVAEGAMVAAPFGPAGEALGGIVGGIRNMLAGGKVEPAVRKVAQALTRDGVPLDEIEQRMKAMGPDATIADIGGENTKSLLAASANTPGEGKDIAAHVLDERHEGQGDRVMKAALGNLGVNTSDVDSVLGSLDRQRKENASPVYKEAFKANPSVQSREIDSILTTPAGRKALKDAATLMQNDRSLLGVNDPELTEQAKLVGSYEPGSGGIAKGLKMQTLDYVKQALDDEYDGLVSKYPRKAAKVAQLSRDLVKEMDTLDTTAIGGKPGKYAQARAAYAGPSQSKDAAEAGKKFINNSVSGVDTALTKISDEDRPFFRIGVASKLQDVIENTPDGADAVKRIFGSPAKRAKLASVFPSREAFEDFERTVKNEAEFYKTRARVQAGSRTTPLKAAMDDAADPSTLGNLLTKGQSIGFTPIGLGAAAAGHPSVLAADIGRALYSRATSPKALTPETATGITRNMLTRQGMKDTANSLTPKQANGRQDLLHRYMENLLAGAAGNQAAH